MFEESGKIYTVGSPTHPLVKIKKTMNESGFIVLLANNLLPFAASRVLHRRIFLKDNDHAPRKAKIVPEVT